MNAELLDDQARATGGSDFDRVGGLPVISSIVDTFIDRVRADMMIGYLFRSVDLERLKERETTFAAEHLGGKVVYSGRPLEVAHAPHAIRGGQFDRRITILSEVLAAHTVDPDIRERWIAHNRALRAKITGDDSGSCAR